MNKEATATPMNVLSFFTGAMGLDLGLERAGMETVLACDSERWMRATIAANRPDIPLIEDIWDYGAEEIRALIPHGEIDVIAGGPPCQSFSTMGARRGLGDAKGNVFVHFINLIKDLQPRYAVVENVRGLLSMPLSAEQCAEYLRLTERDFSGRGGVIRLVTHLLRAAGYGVSFNLYNSANFGVPQVRERVVIIASRDGGAVPHLAPTHSDDSSFNLAPWLTLRDAFSELPEDLQHDYISFPEKRIKYYQMLTHGQNWRNLPPEVQEAAMGNMFHQKTGGRSGFYRRLSWDKPSPTLVTHPAMPATDLGHPVEDRPLSVQEYMAIQQFPQDWIIEGPLLHRYRQLGNAVPVGLGEAIGKSIVAHSAGKPLFPPQDFKFSRYRGTGDGDIAPL